MSIKIYCTKCGMRLVVIPGVKPKDGICTLCKKRIKDGINIRNS